MRLALIFGAFIFLLMSCQSKPKNMCECLDQAMKLGQLSEKTTDPDNQKRIQKKIDRLARHCHHLSTRSGCSSEEISAIIKKNHPQSFWDLGEAVTLVMHRPYAHPASIQWEYKKSNRRDSLNQKRDQYFPRMYEK